MKYPTTRFVFDRKHTATKEKKALIQIEILFMGKKKYVSTGVKVYKDQWNDKRMVSGCMDAIALNARLRGIKDNIDGWINSLINENKVFEWEKMEVFLRHSEQAEEKFIDFVENMIEARKDIRESTRKTHRKLVTALNEFGRIIYSSDLTKANIMAFNDYLISRNIRQTTIYTYHKNLKTYIHEAMRRELLDSDPYVSLKFKRGESEKGRYIMEEELLRIIDLKLPSDTLKKARDLFVIQCLTGMSYADLMSFDFQRVKEKNGQYVLSQQRLKTGVDFTVVLLPEAMEIIKRYGYVLPKFSNQQYNMRL